MSFSKVQREIGVLILFVCLFVFYPWREDWSEIWKESKCRGKGNSSHCSSFWISGYWSLKLELYVECPI